MFFELTKEIKNSLQDMPQVIPENILNKPQVEEEKNGCC